MKLISFGSYTPSVNPTSYSVKLADVDGESSGRGETGYMTRDRARAGVYSIDVTFTNISSDEVDKIKKAVSPEMFVANFFDGTYVDANVYVSDRQLDLKYINEDAEAFWDMSFSIVEY